jgi:hypothetical protein
MAYDLGVTARQKYFGPTYSAVGGSFSIANDYYYHTFVTTGTFTSTSSLPIPIEIVDGGGTVVQSTIIPAFGTFNVTLTTSSSIAYAVHTFNSSGVFVATSGIGNVSALLVAGGGGGGYGRTGNHVGGGGGAGGVRFYENLSISSGAKTITVGSGGAALTSGTNSLITGLPGSVINPTGGGFGGGGGGANGFPGGNGPTEGGNGGSGGGSSGGYGLIGGVGILGEGFNGANGAGGGAGGLPTPNSGGVGGTGGIGRLININNTSTYYGGGGGGAGSTTQGQGGLGGGGRGGKDNGTTAAADLATSGIPNTGGGGGAGAPPNSIVGGNGGSGIVIIKYPTALGSATGGVVTSAVGPGLIIRYPAPPSNSPDPNFKNTTLLLSSDTETTFVEDASGYANSISILGDTKPYDFNPYSENYSLNFNGTTNSLRVASTSTAAFESNDFTIEAWIYVTGSTGTYRTIYSTRPNNATAGIYTGGAFGVNPTGGLYWQTGELVANNASDLLLTNRWNHVAVVKNAGSVNIFLNGSVVPNNDAAGVNAVPVEYLVVAGGGGGGSTGGDGISGQGGGGAGGLLTSQIDANFGVTYPVIVGAGAAVGALNGSTSSFSTVVATGGGRGGSFGAAGLSGGSGGGGGGRTGASGGAGIAGQGSNGGASNTSGFAGAAAGGGGGGAGEQGQAGIPSGSFGIGGRGGNGLVSTISGTSRYYAGGGGGMASTIGGAGGLGGGGTGRSSGGPGDLGAGGNATPNTGGGGGGGSGNGPGLGGSGIIIIRHLNTQPQATVTGGVTITTTGSNIVYTFTASGTISFVQPAPSFYPIDYLAVAGGGAGGAASGSNGGGGGGGAGGVISTSTILTGGVPYAISVGGGGTGVAGNLGNTGSNTIISGANLSTITAIGGGGGGGGNSGVSTNVDGSSGGSGGGGSGDSTFSTPLIANGLGTPGQGNDGGAGGNGTSGNQAGGGGGGAGAAGSASVTNTAGNGGIGLLSSISGTSTYYAGGGGGAQSTVGGSTAGTGGLGGGGNGSNVGINGSPGTPNTGGGGGGAGRGSPTPTTGGSGGSGLVIIRHSATLTQATVTGGVTVASTGGNILYTFTASGSILFAGTAPIQNELTLTTATIGANLNGSEPFSGYISNLRVVKGQGLYTDEFIVGTRPLTTATVGHRSIDSAITGTVALLTAASNRIVDKSPANLSFTTGTAAISNLQPFTYPYSFNGSAYFDGTGDYLTAPADSPLNFGNSDFTIECWIYGTGLSSSNFMILSNDGPTRNAGSISFFATPTNFGIQRIIDTSGNAETIAITGSVPQNQWVHLAATKVGTTVRLFLNGSLVTTQTTSYLSWGNQVNTVQIGRRNITSFENNFIGYISNLRVIQTTAVYTANFTPPTEPLTAIPNTVLLTLQNNIPANNRAFRDTSNSNAIITPVGSVTQGTFGPHGSGWSAYFDGSGDYLTLTGKSLSATNWTIECWVYFNNFTNTTPHIFNFGTDVNNRYVLFRQTSGTFRFSTINAGAGSPLDGTTIVLVGTWYHVAVTRNSSTGVATLYVNGIQEATSTNASLSSGTSWAIGWQHFGGVAGDHINGYISNFRVTNSIVYTTSGLLQVNYTTPGTYSWIAPEGVTSVSVVAVGGGGAGATSVFGGGGGGLGWRNNIAVTPGQSYTVVVGAAGIPGTSIVSVNGGNGGDSYFISTSTVRGGGGRGGAASGANIGGTFTGDGGGNGGAGGFYSGTGTGQGAGGGGAGGYSGNGGAGALASGQSTDPGPAGPGSGGGGGGGGSAFNDTLGNGNANSGGGGGGGVGILGQGANGTAGVSNPRQTAAGTGGGEGSGGAAGGGGFIGMAQACPGGTGGLYGGGGGGSGGVGSGGQPSVTGGAAGAGAVRIISGPNRSFPSTNTADIIGIRPASDLPRISNTALLTLQSNRFVDNGENNFTITRFGNVSIQRFSPYRTPGYNSLINSASMYFNGSTDYLEIPHNANQLIGTNDFTIEAWVYLNNYTSANGVLSKGDATSGTAGVGSFFFGTTGSSGTLGFDISNNFVITGGVIPLNSWNHIAVTRSSGTMYLWLNGVLTANAPIATSINYAAVMRVGRGRGGSTNYFAGYMSDIRLIVGTALYAGPNYQPLTAIDNTVLLTAQSFSFIDNSIYGNTITGVATTSTSVPFSINPGGEGYFSYSFNGTNEVLSVANTSTLNFGANDFTIEAWIYPTDVSGENVIASLYGYSNDRRAWYLAVRSGEILFRVGTGSGASILYSNTAILPNTWYFISAIKQGTTARIYINGVLDATDVGVAGTIYNNTVDPIYIGAVGPNLTGYYQGLISNLRILNGTARIPNEFASLGASNFTVPQTPAKAVTNTVLLLNGTNSAILDRTGRNDVITVGDVRLQKSRIVSGAVAFDGTGDYLNIPYNAAHNLSNGNFTIEAWVYPTTTGVDRGIANNWQTGGQFIYSLSASNTLSFLFTNAAGGVSSGNYIGTTPIAANTWTHVAVVRNGTSLTHYINGVIDAGGSFNIGTQTLFYYNGEPKNLRIGIGGDLGVPFAGIISDFRIVKGTAVYTANFTRPAARLTAITNTLLLTCQQDLIKDYSNNNFTVSALGDARITSDTQFGVVPNAITPLYASNIVCSSMLFGTKTSYLAIRATPNLITFPGNFTFECWVYPTDATISTTWGIWDSRQGGATANPMIFSLGALASPVSGSWRLQYYNGTTHSGTGIVQLNRWSHVAFVRAGSTMTFYVNGIAGGTATISGTQSGNATTNPIWIGTKDNGLAGYGTVGYIDNFRITNGVARYTANFDVPLAPYPTR